MYEEEEGNSHATMAVCVVPEGCLLPVTVGKALGCACFSTESTYPSSLMLLQTLAKSGGHH